MAALWLLAFGGLSQPVRAQTQVVSQSGISFNGTVNATPLGDTIIMSGNANWPASTFLDSFAFRGGIVVGGYLYLLPNEATEIVKVEIATRTMTGIPLPALGGARDKFVGAAFDGTYIWFIPRDADAVVRLDTADDSTTRFDAWPAGFTKGPGAFSGGIFDGRYVWMVPHNADRVIRLDTTDGSMTGFSNWPAGFTKGPAAFWGGVFDGTSMWMFPFNADRVVKIDTTTGVMTGYNNWPANYTLPTRAFAGGAFDGTRVWMAAYDSDRIISIDVATGAMTGYGTVHDATQWPSGYVKMPGNFNGALYDGDDVWFVPFESADLIKVDVATGQISKYRNYPAGIDATKLDKWAGAAIAGQKLFLIPGVEMTLVTIEPTPAPAVTAITRFGPPAQDTALDSVVFRVDFNKPVSGIDASDFTLSATGSVSGSIAWVSAASGDSVTVTIDNIAGDGTLRLDLVASGTGIVDDYGYALEGGFTAGESYRIDNTAPVITSASAATVTYRGAFSYAITTDAGDAVAFGASGLPAGLSLDPGTGVISGNPAQTGTFNIALSATDAAGNQGSASLTLQVDPAPLTVSGLAAADKVYDGTTGATLLTGGAALSGVLTGDDVQLALGGASAAFAEPDAGNGKTVLVSGLSLSGADAAHYTLTVPALAASITPKPLTVNGMIAADKVYDGTAAASIDFAAVVLDGVVPGDQVALVTAAATATFADANAGSGKTVSVTGLTLSGAQAGNYQIVVPSLSASIAPRVVTVSGWTVSPRLYDGTVSAPLDFTAGTLEGVVPGDAVALDTAGATAVYADPAAGAGKPVSLSGVTLSGADAANYTLLLPSLTGDIAARPVSVSGITVADKVYDGTTAAAIDFAAATLSGVVAGDDVVLDTAAASAAFGSATAGVDKPVGLAGLALTGADAGNYTLQTPVLTATIAPKPLTVTGITAADKTYDRSLAASLDVSAAAIAGVVPGDSVALDAGGAVGVFADARVGEGKPVAVSGLSLVGAAAANYTLVPADVHASIQPKNVVVGGVVARNKVYDGTTAAVIDATGAWCNGVISGDDVSLDTSAVTGAFADPEVGSGKPVTISGLALAGPDAGNYRLIQPVSSAAIAPAAATITLAGLERVYDGTPRAVSVETDPAGLSVQVTYAGAPAAPTAVGDYAVRAEISDPNYFGVAVGTLRIVPAPATVRLGGLIHPYDGQPHAATVETVPAGLVVRVTYDGASAAPSAIGRYAVVATVEDPNYTGSANAELIIDATSRLANLSNRSEIGRGEAVVISGFVIEGSGRKRLLIRGIGPELAREFGVADALAAPVLKLFSGETEIAANDGWDAGGDGESIRSAIMDAGAFELPEGSRDAALLATLEPGAYTVHLAGAEGETGTGLIEVYDLDSDGRAARLKNLSTRTHVGRGDAGVLIPGYVIAGAGPRRILVRAMGPGLAAYGVEGFLADPQIMVSGSGGVIAANDNWEDAADLAALVEATTEVGAEAFDEGSRDAAILLDLEPGAYTIRVSGVNDTTGIALVEVFEVE